MRTRAAFDDGWVGKWANGVRMPIPGTGEWNRSRGSITVEEEEQRPFLFYVEDGVLHACWPGDKIGFQR